MFCCYCIAKIQKSFQLCKIIFNFFFLLCDEHILEKLAGHSEFPTTCLGYRAMGVEPAFAS